LARKDLKLKSKSNLVIKIEKLAIRAIKKMIFWC